MCLHSSTKIRKSNLLIGRLWKGNQDAGHVLWDPLNPWYKNAISNVPPLPSPTVVKERLTLTQTIGSAVQLFEFGLLYCQRQVIFWSETAQIHSTSVSQTIEEKLYVFHNSTAVVGGYRILWRFIAETLPKNVAINSFGGAWSVPWRWRSSHVREEWICTRRIHAGFIGLYANDNFISTRHLDQAEPKHQRIFATSYFSHTCGKVFSFLLLNAEEPHGGEIWVKKLLALFHVTNRQVQGNTHS